MAALRVAILDDYKIFAEMLACPLQHEGISTLCEIQPMNFERLVQFGPDLLVLGMSRRKGP